MPRLCGANTRPARSCHLAVGAQIDKSLKMGCSGAGRAKGCEGVNSRQKGSMVHAPFVLPVVSWQRNAGLVFGSRLVSAAVCWSCLTTPFGRCRCYVGAFDVSVGVVVHRASSHILSSYV